VWSLLEYAYLTVDGQLDRYDSIGFYPTMLEALDHERVTERTDPFYDDQAIGAVFAERFERDLELYDDALETVRVLADAGVRIAVASSSRREQVVAVLERGDLTGLVQAVVGQQDVSAHKPDPEPYLTAARLLEVDPTRCAAVEDTPVGVAAAVAAGMFTVGILRRSTDPSELGAAHRVVRRITVPALTPAWGTAPR
jgi:HAD superfamily hydrolase (TIGR01509 family)